MRIFIFLLTLFPSVAALAQAGDKPAKEPEFKTIKLSEDRLPDFNLVSNYYTVDKNISNPQSPVFLTDQPSAADYIRFARTLPSYYFLIKRKDSVLYSIIVNQEWEGIETRFTFTVFDPANKKRISIPCKTEGEISELRAAEMHQLKFDSNAKWIDMPTGKMFEFNGLGYRIQPYFALKDEVIKLSQTLYDKSMEAVRERHDYVIKETRDGKLDFEKALADEPSNKVFEVDGVRYSKGDYITYLWAKAVHKVGVPRLKEARLLWEECRGRVMNESEYKVLKSGFQAMDEE